MGRLLDSCDGRGWKGQLSAWSHKPSHVESEFWMDSGVSKPTNHATTRKVKVVLRWVVDLM